MSQDALKQAVARRAVDFVVPNQVLGVGTGSTANFFIEALVPIKHSIPAAVASSIGTAQRLSALGINVVDLNEVDSIAVYVDGADEIDPSGAMIKGGGAALTREKIVASVAKQFICIADASKKVDALGAFALPIEVIPMAQRAVAAQLTALGAQPKLRAGVVTDNGCVIIDVNGLRYADAKAWEARLNQIVGVVTVGLFAARGADIALIGSANGIEEIRYS